MSAGHAINGVVDEDRRDAFAAGGRVYDFGSTDRCNVAIALVGKDNAIGMNPLDTGSNRRCTTMRRLDHIDVEIVISQRRTTYRSDANRPVNHFQFIDDFGNKAMDYAMVATGTVMCRHIQ